MDIGQANHKDNKSNCMTRCYIFFMSKFNKLILNQKKRKKKEERKEEKKTKNFNDGDNKEKIPLPIKNIQFKNVNLF